MQRICNMQLLEKAKNFTFNFFITILPSQGSL